MENEFDSDKNLLSHYGEYLFCYLGIGGLKVFDGTKELNFPCQFEAGQLINGKILLICSNLREDFGFLTLLDGFRYVSFEGLTNEGHFVRTNPLHEIEYLPDYDNGSWGHNIALRVNELTIIFSNFEEKSMCIGLTNCEFGEIYHQNTTTDDVSINLEIDEFNLKIHRIKDYYKILKKTKFLRGIQVFSEITTNIKGNGDIKIIQKILENLCNLLSIAEGRKIQWIYYSIFDEIGSLQSRSHFARIAGRYSPLSIIPLKDNEILEHFLKTSYSKYPPTNVHFNNWIIEEYLASKREGDYLEIRALKIVVAIEILKVLNEKSFIKSIKSKKMNFRPFVRSLCEKINMDVEEQDINLFWLSRNSLIHEGFFYYKTATDENKKIANPHKNAPDEFFFLLNFFDRIILKLLEYQGSYYNWRTPGDFKEDEFR